jgi:hypothetical protein
MQLGLGHRLDEALESRTGEAVIHPWDATQPMSSLVARSVRAAVLRVGWLGIAAVLALGTAGIVSGLDAPPDSPARAELTWAADEAAAPGLAAAADDLEAVSAEVEALGRLGRGALASLVARDIEALSGAISDGQAVLVEIDAGTARVRDRLRRMPGFGEHAELRVGRSLRERYDLILQSLSATTDLQRSWVRLTSGTVAATSLTTLLADHDRFAAAAAKFGRGGRYADALEQLGRSEKALAAAGKLRDQLANTADVEILDQWLTRNQAMDKALRTLYTALRKSPNRVTKEVRDAYAAVQRAQKNLPPDTKGLVVIMADISRGGLNQAVISIEEARGRLTAAVDAVRAAEASAASVAP